MTGASIHQLREPFVAAFSEEGALRQAVGQSGRAHLDRWLPFVVLHRTADPKGSIAHRIAIHSPAYLVWSPEDDRAAEAALAAIAGELCDRFGRILLIEVADAPWAPPEEGSQALPPFAFAIAASDGAGAQKALDSLADALRDVEIDLRGPEIIDGVIAPAPADPAAAARTDRLAMTIPQIHRADENHFYPQLTRELIAACGDALLRAACAYMEGSEAGAPSHYRALGRSAFLAAALDADHKLDRVARSYDFLLSVSPINSAEAMERFFADKAQQAPLFRYRPLTVEPDTAKRDLYNVDLSILEDMLLERLLAEKRQEIDHQLTMLATRNTADFQAASMLHYGGVDAQLLSDAHAILEATPPARTPGERLDAEAVAAAARALVGRYQAADPRFEARIEVRDDVGSLLVSGGKLMVASSISVPAARIEALLAHEVSVHLLTWFNGAQQGLSVFRTGLARYEGVQEGLGVFAEWAVGGLSAARLRLLAGRVVAVAAMLDGATFVDLFRLLTRDHGLAKRPAFDIAARVFRSGGFAKDYIYLKGFRSVFDMVAAGVSLDPFWSGKIAPAHLPAIEELLQRGLVQPPLFRPEFLERDAPKRRIAKLRSGLAFEQILDADRDLE